MHGRFNPVTAVEMARELAPFKPSWVEEPVPPSNLPALKKAADAIAPLGVPVATGDTNALSLGVTPFLIGDAIKLVLAGTLLPGAWALANRKSS